MYWVFTSFEVLEPLANEEQAVMWSRMYTGDVVFFAEEL